VLAVIDEQLGDGKRVVELPVRMKCQVATIAVRSQTFSDRARR
jgi:hypothetical protein